MQVPAHCGSFQSGSQALKTLGLVGTGGSPVVSENGFPNDCLKMPPKAVDLLISKIAVYNSPALA